MRRVRWWCCTTALIADGAPYGVLADPAVIEAYLGHRYAERQRSGSGGA